MFVGGDVVNIGGNRLFDLTPPVKALDFKSESNLYKAKSERLLPVLVGFMSLGKD